MAKIPGGQERVVFSGASIPGGRAVPQSQNPVANALRAWAANEQERSNQRALENVQQAATRAQQAANQGIRQLAETPEDTTGVFAEAFEQQARAVFSADLANDATRELGRLSREHPDDPDAFGQKFNAYMQGQLKPLMEADATAGEEVRQKLDAMGTEVQLSIEENAAARAREESRVGFLQNANQLSANLADQLLTSEASETDLASAIAEVQERWEGASDSGLVGREQAATAVQSETARLTREFVRGRFQRAVEAGDVPGATGVIEHLRSGGMFDDNEAGRILANKLERELQARIGEAGGTRAQLESIAMRDLKAWDAARQAGAQVSAPEEAVSMLLNSSNPNTRDRAGTVLRKSQLREQNAFVLNRGSRSALQAQRDRVVATAGDTDAEFVTAQTELIDERIAELDRARNTNDPLGVVPGLTLDSSMAERNAARDQAARIKFELPPNAPVSPEQRAAIPSVSRKMAQQAEERLETAISEGRTQDAQAVISELLKPELNNPAQMAAMGAVASREFAATAVISSVAGADVGADVFSLSQRGQRAPNEFQEAGRKLLQDEDILPKIREAAGALSFGNPEAGDGAFEMLRNSFLGLFREGRDAGKDDDDTVSQFEQLLTPLLDSEKLDNGILIPRQIAGETPAEVRATVGAVNEAIGERSEEVFGEDFALDEGARQSLVPVFSEDGPIFFADTRRGGALVNNAETGEPAFIDPSGTVQQAQAEAERQAAEPPGEVAEFFGNLTSDPLVEGPGSTFDGVMKRREIPLAATSAGVEPGLLDSVFSAGRFLPPRERSGRQPQFFFEESNLEVLDRQAYRQAWRQREAARRQIPVSAVDTPEPDPFRSVTGGALASGILLKQLGERFDGSDQALAAYWLGAEKVDTLIEERGEDWLMGTSIDTRQFISRVEDSARGRL